MSEQDLARARWEDQADVSHKFRFNFKKFWLGRAEDGAPVGYNDDRHICLVSGTRGGKGRNIIVNNLSFWPGSAVVIDPKGENATVTAARRGQGNEFCAGMQQKVVVLDPFGVAVVDGSYRGSFNPLDALDPTSERCIDDAARIANALIVVREDSKDPFFDESARALVKAIILHVLTSELFDEGQRTLSMVHDLLKRGDWRIAQAARDAGEEMAPHQALFRSMEENLVFDGVVAGNGARYVAMLQNSPKTFDNVLQSALINTEFLDSPGMRRVVQSSSFKLSQLKDDDRGATLYLCLPQDYMDTHYRWLRLMVMLTIGAMQKSLHQPATGHRVLFVLDEFAGLKRMAAIENAVAQLAGFGVKLLFVLQSLEQLKATYKENWETFLANAGLKIFFGIEDHFTRKYVSDLMGTAEVIRYTDSASQGTTESENVSHGKSRSQNESHGTAESMNSSHTQGTSTTDTTGKSWGTGQSRSQGENWGRNESVTAGRSQGLTDGRSESLTDGRNESVTNGRSDGQNWSNGSSRGISFKKTSFLGLFESIDARSVGYTSGSNTSFGGSSSTSSSRTNGGSSSQTSGTSSSRTDGTSSSRTNGSSYGMSDSMTLGSSEGSSESQSSGQSLSVSESQGHSTNRSHSHGDTQSENRSRGNSRSINLSRNQAIHQRPLLRPEEFGKLFARIDDPDRPNFPGMALVLINGADPIVVRRCNYDDDVQFIDWFTPDPHRKYTPPVAVALNSIEPFVDKLTAVASPQTGQIRLSGWKVTSQHVINAGDVLFQIENVPPVGGTVNIRSPRDGKAITLSGTSGWPYMDADPVFLLKHYPGQEGSIVDPIAELREACAMVEVAPLVLVSKPIDMPELVDASQLVDKPELVDEPPVVGWYAPAVWDEPVAPARSRFTQRQVVWGLAACSVLCLVVLFWAQILSFLQMVLSVVFTIIIIVIILFVIFGVLLAA